MSALYVLLSFWTLFNQTLFKWVHIKLYPWYFIFIGSPNKWKKNGYNNKMGTGMFCAWFNFLTHPNITFMFCCVLWAHCCGLYVLCFPRIFSALFCYLVRFIQAMRMENAQFYRLIHISTWIIGLKLLWELLLHPVYFST